MNKIKYIFSAVIISFLLYGCPSDTAPVDNFNHAAQAVKDNDSLVMFLKKHYFDTVIDSIKPITANETALFDDVKLKSKSITEKINDEDIDFTLYYYVNRVGTPEPIKGFPTAMDSVFVKYEGKYLKKTDTLVFFEKNNTPSWFTLSGVIRAWTHGLQKFKGGKNTTSNGPITYENGGKGILFIPSGLAYRNEGSISIPGSSPLVFYINLFDIVENTDLDNDGVPSIYEDPDGDGDPRNDDTDKDRIPNFSDTDDDNDGVLTKDEDANGDGDPSNDFSDPDNPDLPDYLNPDIK